MIGQDGIDHHVGRSHQRRGGQGDRSNEAEIRDVQKVFVP